MRRIRRATESVGASGRKQWSLAFLAFFLVFAGWAFAAPYDAPPDEVQHAIRAAGVVSGEIAPKPVVIPNWNGKGDAGMGANQRVPVGLRSPATCWGFNPGSPASCAQPVHGGPLGEVPTSAGRYHPTYYLAVGLPLRLWPGWPGLVLSRLISAAMSAALLASALVVLVCWSRYGLMLAGLLLSTSPMLAHLAGAVNPNGLEIAAGIALFAGGIPLLLGPADRAGPASPAARRLIWLVGISAVLLATVRSLGPVWLLFALLALLVPQSRQRLGGLLRQRLVRRWAVGVAVAVALSAAWIIVMKTGQVVPTGNHRFNYGVAQAGLIYFQQWESFLRGMVGVAGWFDIMMPSPFYVAWSAAVISLVVFAGVVSGRAERWRFAVVLFGGLVVPGFLQVAQANVVGFIIGGRYMMPLMVGLPLLAAFILEQRLLTARQSATLTRLFCLVLLPTHAVLLVYAMVRWQRGAIRDPHVSYLNPLAGSWHPPTGSLTPLVLMTAGLILLAAVFWWGLQWAAAGPARTTDDDEPVADAQPSVTGPVPAGGARVGNVWSRTGNGASRVLNPTGQAGPASTAADP